MLAPARMTEAAQDRTWLKALGPGFLFAAAAVGVSHLVQSTRAGAVYGVALLGMVVAANAMKYAAFRFGPHYAAATGTSLLEGYRRQGRWALAVYALLTLGTMFTVQAAVTVVTAGLAIATLGIQGVGALGVSAALIAVCATLLAVGRYHWLDRVTKLLVAVLTVCTLVATAVALPRVNLGGPWAVTASQLDRRTILFIAALVGWMPSAIDVAVWQSLWTLARRNDSGHTPSLRQSSLDFHIGYVGTAVLAVCFLLMGAGVMHQSGVVPAGKPAAFAAQIIGLYTTTLGAWSGPVVGIAAFAVMFSTTLTVLDGFPRAISVLLARVRGGEDAAAYEMDERPQRLAYWIALVVLAVGSLLVLWKLVSKLTTMVDIATTLSFLTAPMLSVLNHRAVLGPEVPAEHRPRPWLVLMSWFGIVTQSAFALYYLFVRFG